MEIILKKYEDKYEYNKFIITYQVFLITHSVFIYLGK